MSKRPGPVLHFAVDDGFRLPDVESLAGGPPERTTVQVCDTYVDTADADLLSHNLQLRRREGDGDTGWQLAIPGEEGPLDVRTDASEPPSELADLLFGVTLGKPLTTVATMRTRHDRYRFASSGRGRLRALLLDERTHASIGDRMLAWRQIEIGCGPAARSLPDDLADRLSMAGAVPTPAQSKVARVLRVDPPCTVERSDAEQALADYLSEQIDIVFAGDLGLRRGHDPIHDTRVAIRRLRSTLRVFGKLLDGPSADHVETELKWFAGLLGEVRDCQVQMRRFGSALAELPDDLVLGPVEGRINSELRSQQHRSRAEVTDAMSGARYLDLLTTLQRWRTDPPLAGPPTAKALTKRAGRAQRKADRRLAQAVRAGDDALLHRARKAAKRARYAAELLTPLNKRTKATVKRYKRIQRVLGDHQDGVVATGTLRRLALVAGTAPGENGFTFGLLYQREQENAADAFRRARELLV
ncbi:CYTH and CHAD domain-containing protein [Mycobacterium sp. IDR2000157661]|uniref:CYTH and CHAD domain-containing protein n=1 Tax=Mycobacterium sp. IDR2000157661 TaxID=2867005 RepID=UPI001EEC28EA|nr:CYTH and CHAD domain-containing protein [Mycobacterium sp. IDR2000157661]ULE33357.1 CYTH and CHAD domain-containing protein [Mycobacterium sp. IDR2000157661]